MVSSLELLELHGKFCYGDFDSYLPHLVMYHRQFLPLWWANPVSHTCWKEALPALWEQMLRPRLHYKAKLSLPAPVKGYHRQQMIPFKAQAQHWRLEQFGSTRQVPAPSKCMLQRPTAGCWSLVFLGGEASGLFFRQLITDFLLVPSTDLLFSSGACVCANGNHWASEGEAPCTWGG